MEYQERFELMFVTKSFICHCLWISSNKHISGGWWCKNLSHCAKSMIFGMEVPKTKENSLSRGSNKMQPYGITMTSKIPIMTSLWGHTTKFFLGPRIKLFSIVLGISMPKIVLLALMYGIFLLFNTSSLHYHCWLWCHYLGHLILWQLLLINQESKFCCSNQTKC